MTDRPKIPVLKHDPHGYDAKLASVLSPSEPPADVMASFEALAAHQDIPIWYLATPYSDYPKGHSEAWITAVRLSGALMAAGYMNYSPIAHFHPIAKQAKLPTDAAFWHQTNMHFMFMCRGLIVAKMPGWRQSKGVTAEIAEYEKMGGRPIVYFTVPSHLL